MLVKATDKYEKLNIKDLELNKIPKKGEIFEVSEKRYKILTKENEYHEIFVKKVEEVEEIETATKKSKERNSCEKEYKEN